MTPELLDQAREVIDEELRARFDVPFVKITVKPDYDRDGDEFLWVNAVYDGQPDDIDTRKSITLVREIRPRLDDIPFDAFPVVRYIAKSDLTKRELEAI